MLNLIREMALFGVEYELPIFERNEDGEFDIDGSVRRHINKSISWEKIFTMLGRWGLSRELKQHSTGVYYTHCVFHSERTPSLALRPSGYFKCYGCGKNGDKVDFISLLLPKVAGATQSERIAYFFYRVWRYQSTMNHPILPGMEDYV
jgi:hypothetical protein